MWFHQYFLHNQYIFYEQQVIFVNIIFEMIEITGNIYLSAIANTISRSIACIFKE